MIDLFTRDVLAVVTVVYGFAVAWLEFSTWQRSKLRYRWVFLVQAFAGFLCSLVFIAALLRLYNGGDAIDAAIGRPMFIILLTGLVISAIVDRRRGNNECS
jgi:hypothetical protein